MSDETRRRVLEIASQLNYRPSAVARSLRQGGTKTVGFYSGYGSVDVRNDFFGELIHGLQLGCDEHGLHFMLHGAFPGLSTDEVFGEMMSGRIDGLVVFAPEDDALVARLATSTLPVIAVADDISSLLCVMVDEDEGARLIVQHLKSRGHREVLYGFSWPAPIHDTAQRRFAAFQRAATECGLKVRKMLHERDEAAMPSLVVRELQDRKKSATAAVCWEDGTAELIADACHEIGWRVPQDLAIVGFNGCWSERKLAHQLTTIRAPWSQLGQTAIAQLLDLKNGQEVPSQTLLPVEFVVGETT